MECSEIINSYIKFIKDNTSISHLPNANTCVVTTPFLDNHNDHIKVYVKKDNGVIKLTDDGLTISDLEMSGLDFSSPKRLRILQTILNGFNVEIENDGEIFITANNGNIGQRKHNLLQAILAINDMYNLAGDSVASLFKEDVERFFKIKNIFYTKDIKLSGKTGFDHNIDFLITASKNKPERLVKTINKLTKDNISNCLFVFSDIEAKREVQTENYVIYNDEEGNSNKGNKNQSVLSALRSYNTNAIAWSERENFINFFVS